MRTSFSYDGQAFVYRMSRRKRRPYGFWTNEHVIEELQTLHARGVPMTDRDIGRVEKSLLVQAKNRFGSLAVALEAAGLEQVRLLNRSRNWSTEAVISEIRERTEGGCDLSYGAARFENPSLVSASVRYFGSWEAAVEAAGLDYAEVRRRHERIPEAEIIETIQRMAAEGKPLHYAALARDDPIIARAMTNRYGSFDAALEAAGIDKERKEHPPTVWSADSVVERIRELHASGEDISPAKMSKEHSTLFAAARYYHGAWSEAVEKAGIDYSTIVRKRGRPPKAE